MRFGYPGGARQHWYDRDPSNTSLGYRALGVGPHATTQRATYTVPSGRKAWISNTYAEIVRETVATTLVGALCMIYVASIYYAQVYHRLNTVGAREIVTPAGGALLFPGDQVIIATQSGDTAGTVAYCSAAIVTEYSA